MQCETVLGVVLPTVRDLESRPPAFPDGEIWFALTEAALEREGRPTLALVFSAGSCSREHRQRGPHKL